MTAERIEEGILRLSAIDLRMKSEAVDARLLLETALLSFRPLKPAAKGAERAGNGISGLAAAFLI